MDQMKVLLICMLPLLCEGLRRILEAQDDLQLLSLDCADPVLVQTTVHDFAPNTVLIAGEQIDDRATHLISDLLNQWPDVPVIWVELETNLIRLYTSHTLPANSHGLIAALHREGLRTGADSPPFKPLGRT